MATCAWHYILPRAMKVLGGRSMLCCVGVVVTKCIVSGCSSWQLPCDPQVPRTPPLPTWLLWSAVLALVLS